ncbi:MAG: cupredoxin domain-containing protein [Dehalococcoidia bacterium]
MKRILVALVLVSIPVLLALACGGGSEEGLPPPGPGGETVIRVEMRDYGFSPSALTIRAGQDYLLELRNKDDEAHNLRIAGIDDKYETGDDIVSNTIKPGKTDSLPLHIDQPGIYRFRSDSQPIRMKGDLTVWELPPIATLPPVTPSPSPTAEAESPTPTAEAVSPTPTSTPAGE